MKKIYSKGLFALVAGAILASCADYNEIDNFVPKSGAAASTPYSEYATVKSYIDKSKYPNLTIGTALSASDFKSQELAHAAAVTNFDYVSLGTGLMSGKFMKSNGVKDFTDLQEILAHTKAIGFDIYGSPIAANTGQAFGWLEYLTSPIQIYVEYQYGDKIDYSTMDKYTGSSPDGVIDAANKALKVAKRKKVNIIEGIKLQKLSKYTFQFTAMTNAGSGKASFVISFNGVKVDGPGTNGVWTLGTGDWRTIILENLKTPEGAEEGYLTIENTVAGDIWVSDIEYGFYPDDHRDQTEEEVRDTINYALNTWCDALMQYNAGRMTSFDLIEDALDTKDVLENGMYNLKHSTTSSIYWQDVLGNENYAPKVSKATIAAYEKHGGNASDLKLFVAESNLINETRMQSLNYWMNIWEANGARIDGINAKLPLTYNEDAEKQAANEAAVEKLMQNLAATGKLVRISNLDINYLDAGGKGVAADKATDVQRQNIADYYAYVIKKYLQIIPAPQVAGISKGNLVDTSEPVGLWYKSKEKYNKEDWVRTPAYKAWCDALSGK